MFATTLAFGWVGVMLFLLLSIFLQSLLRKNEFALIHVLLIFIFTCWLPIAFSLAFFINGWAAKIGTLFCVLALIMFIIAMALQTGYIVYSNKHSKENKDLWEANDEWMMNLLSDPIEMIAGIFNWIGAIFIGTALLQNNYPFFAAIIFLLSLQLIYCLALLFRTCVNAPPKWIQSIKPNSVVLNLGLFLYYLILLLFLVIHHLT
ncbi:hypothetical protein ABWW58_14385 [Sporolactobacillus sp. STCC-11]|uniref:hypothetical protein n=1 Tax=Sporolactobacillus caesalpiniae TaxID=3230362 RepID=UPI00339ACCCF